MKPMFVQFHGIIYISGQLSHSKDGSLVAPAPLDDYSKPVEFSNMETQLRCTYEKALIYLSNLLRR